MSLSSNTRPSLLIRIRDLDDQAGWEEFVEIYSPAVYNYCRRNNLQESDAADVTQEVFKVLTHLIPQFDYNPTKGKFRSWLLQVTRHHLSRFFQRSTRVPQPISDSAIEFCLESDVQENQDPLWESAYRRRLFQWASDKVRPEFHSTTWTAFWSTAIESLSVKDCAEQLGITSGAVYVARSRVIARIRTLIESVSDETDDFLSK